MKRSLRALALSSTALLLPALALAQSAPANMDYHTVYGRLGSKPGDTGPGQAIPFATLRNQIIPFAFPLYADDYGCKGDGVTNDTNCIKNVIQVANGTREVVLSGKSYCVDPIKIGDGGLPVPPRIGGVSGYVTTLIACGASASPTLTYSNFSFDTQTSVHDLRIRANGLHPTGLLIHGCQFCSFERIRVQGATGYGWVIHGEPGYNVQYNSFRDVVSRGNNGGGFRFYSDNNAGDYYVAANHCSGMRSESNLGDGINIDYATVDCNGAEFESNTGNGVNTDHTKGGVWNPAHIEGNGLVGIWTTANTTNLHFQGGRIDSISALFLTCASCSVDQTDGAGQNNGFLQPTGIAVGQTATNPGTGNINLAGGKLQNNGVDPVGTGAYVRAASVVTTINGTACTLGSSCAPAAAASSIAVGTTTISSGTPNGLLFDNAGVLGNLATAASGVLVTSAGSVPSVSNTLPSGITIPSPILSGTVAGAGTIPNSVLVNAFTTINGQAIALGASGTVAASATTLTGTSLNSGVLASSLTSVSTLTGGATGAGFTVNLGTSTVSGTLPCANHPALTGDVTTSAGNCATTLTNAPVIAKVLTGYTSGAGTISAADSILSAIQKLNGNNATNANMTGDVTSVGNATTLAAGNASNLNSGTLLAARMPALTGACTTSAGAVATSCIVNTPISFSGSNTGSIVAGVTNYIGAGILCGTGSVCAFPMIMAGTVKGMTCYVSTPPGAGQSTVCTLQRGVSGAAPTDTTMTCTISTTANVCATPDTTHTFSVAVNDVLVIKVLSSAGAATTVNASGQIILATTSP